MSACSAAVRPYNRARSLRKGVQGAQSAGRPRHGPRRHRSPRRNPALVGAQDALGRARRTGLLDRHRHPRPAGRASREPRRQGVLYRRGTQTAPRQTLHPRGERCLLRRLEGSLARLRQAAAADLDDRGSGQRPASSDDDRRRASPAAHPERVEGQPGGCHRREPDRAVHLARGVRLDAAHRQFQRESHRAESRRGRHPQRDDPRDAYHPDRRPQARRRLDQRLHG
jgi:hypothetical protein